jgi:pimeloyl-ACP methyl ester carboxylesterase
MLVGIDGTNSRTWFNGPQSRVRNSHVFNFCADYASGEGAYFPGPNDSITGLDVGDLVDKTWALVSGKLRQAVEPIDLVGYSRGGLAVILLAQRLQGWKTGPVLVRFLGLYDAVDRTPTRWCKRCVMLCVPPRHARAIRGG